jgi:hypothetical protein
LSAICSGSRTAGATRPCARRLAKTAEPDVRFDSWT